MKTISYSEERMKTRLTEILHDATWGTIGRESVLAARELAALIGREEGLLCASPAGAAECILRALEVCRGDEVVLPAYCSPFLKNAVEAVGAKCVFCEVSDGLLMRPEYLEIKLTPATVAVFCEQTAGYPAPMEELFAICNQHDVPLIDCSRTAYLTRYDSRPTGQFCDFALCVLPVQDCAAILTDHALMPKLYGAHHCGNPYGTPGGLNTGICLGGDMRVDEFRAGAVREFLATAEETARQTNSVKIRLKEAFLARGLEPVPVLARGDSAGTHLLFLRGGKSYENEACLPYEAYTESARACAEGVVAFRVL